jgi:hypothetical protein
VTLETVTALSDSELAQVITWAEAESKARAEHKKQETIAKIKQLAVSVGVRVAIGGRGAAPFVLPLPSF